MLQKRRVEVDQESYQATDQLAKKDRILRYRVNVGE